MPLEIKKGLRLLCSTEFFWGSDIGDAITYMVRSGCEGVLISTEPPHYFPSMLHRENIRTIRDLIRNLDITVAVRSPETDVNLFSSNPYISEASQRSIEDSINLSLYLNADFSVIRPSNNPVPANYSVFLSKLQRILAGIGRDAYIALELIGDNSEEIVSRIRERRLGVIYVDGRSSEGLLRSDRLVGISVYFHGSQPLRVIPGMRASTPYLLLYPSQRRMHRAEDFRRIVARVKNWREGFF
ncbi:MAG: hypothetical protein NZ992_02400 [Candidatus Korarchaeum sp.]|nr:hypothetical protein [Candidatus Korarchaeum sp.]MDW8036059.1 hypothetical protein [Candidatus Korarchaeum sp.]